MSATARIWLATFVLLSLTVPTWGASRQTNGSGTDVSREAEEAVQATKEYAAQQKEAFEKTVQKELNDIQANLRQLQRKTTEASEEARAELQKALTELEKKKEVARKKLEEVNAASSSAWSALKDGMNAALEDLKNSYDDAISRLP